MKRNTQYAIRNTIVKNLMIFSIFLLSGCAGLSENIKGFAGYPIKILERNRNSAIIKNLDYDYPAAYSKVIDILRRADTYIYVQDPKKGLVAVYVSETDTTPVGIFFTEKDAGNTQIEISSPSIYGKEVIAKRITLGLEGGHPDAKE